MLGDRGRDSGYLVGEGPSRGREGFGDAQKKPENSYKIVMAGNTVFAVTSLSWQKSTSHKDKSKIATSHKDHDNFMKFTTREN